MSKKKPVFDLNVDRGEKPKARIAAANPLRKSARINIRISEIDLEHIKRIEGLPYQTLIASVLHKYAAGHLNNCLRE